MERKYIAVSNGYIQKYYLDELFVPLPVEVKKEIKATLVKFTMKNGGIISVFFNEQDELTVEASCSEDDILYDKISASLEAQKLVKEKEDLFKRLKMYYDVFVIEKE